jgi:hypothetical protein
MDILSISTDECMKLLGKSSGFIIQEGVVVIPLWIFLILIVSTTILGIYLLIKTLNRLFA